MKQRRRRTAPRALGALAVTLLFTFAACSSGASPSASSGGAAPSTAASVAPASPAAGGSTGTAGGTKHVSILNKDMTDDEIKAVLSYLRTVPPRTPGTH